MSKEKGQDSGKIMYDSSEVVRKLNHVEGFTPKDYLQDSEIDGKTGKYLPTPIRKIWFSLVHPEGHIRKRVIHFDEKVAAIEAKVYKNIDDPDEKFIGSGMAHRTLAGNGNFYLEIAETAATGRALADANFGSQFADIDISNDEPDVVDKPVPTVGDGKAPAAPETGKADKGSGRSARRQSGKQKDTPAAQAQQDEDAGTQPPEQGNNDDTQAPKEKSELQASTESADTPSQTELDDQQSTDNKAAEAPGPDLASAAPNADEAGATWEELAKTMTIEEAKKVVVNIGHNQGKTLGQVAIEKPNQILWYAETYRGSNQHLKAGANVLLNAAKDHQAAG